MQNHKVKIIITGGTIDGLDYEREGDAPKDHKTLIPDLLKRARVSADYDVEVLMQKDSRAISDSDRQLILERCQESIENEIIITHGTYTMPLTAKYLGRANLGKTIVLVGSAIPANEENSDALFNLGGAFIATQASAMLSLPRGVYVVMNGKVFPWDNVQKDLSTGSFKEED